MQNMLKKIDLKEYGWNDFFQSKFDALENKKLFPGRVISVHKSKYEVVLEGGIFSCEVLGNIQFQKDPLGLPAVGDFVACDFTHNTYVVHHVLARKNIIKRQKKHDSFPKAIAANLDQAIIVQSVGEDFSIKRLERILVHVYEAAVRPLVVINKIDLVSEEELSVLQKELLAINKDIPVILTSFISGQGITELENKFIPGQSVMFIGSSGVGKSSIINYMVGHELQETQEITHSTGKGKHTTTARRLIRMDSGVLVVDTPGTREFGMNEDDNEAIKQSFVEIESIATECRFSNCGHTNEPKCAVQESIQSGRIEKENYERYLNLQNENQKTAKQMRQSGKMSSKSAAGQPLRSTRAGKGSARKKMFR